MDLVCSAEATMAAMVEGAESFKVNALANATHRGESEAEALRHEIYALSSALQAADQAVAKANERASRARGATTGAVGGWAARSAGWTPWRRASGPTRWSTR